MKETDIEQIIRQFINATNAFDVETAIRLFADNAVIEDVSVGKKFENIKGVRKYIEEYFVGYHTVTKLESLEILDEEHVKVQVDFTGDFGHETGGLNVTFNTDGLIIAVDAYLD